MAPDAVSMVAGAVVGKTLDDFFKELQDSDKQRLRFEDKVTNLLGNLTHENPETFDNLSAGFKIQDHVRRRAQSLIITNNDAAVSLFTLVIGGNNKVNVYVAGTSTAAFSLRGLLIDRGVSIQLTTTHVTFSAYLSSNLERDSYDPTTVKDHN